MRAVYTLQKGFCVPGICRCRGKRPAGGESMTIREHTEWVERQTLQPAATCAADSKGRLRPQAECEYRTAFARDRDRIMHSKAFRRLKQKTQVFLAPVGDHYRTRMTHTLEVAQIARTISRALRLNEDLTEAIALGHDLGHTPFGHAGERALNEVASLHFSHHVQSLRVVDLLERDFAGLNLTFEVRNGILHHPRSMPPAATAEGRVVTIADKIAYITHDINDATRAEILNMSDIPREIRAVLGENTSEIITAFVRSLVQNSRGADIRFDSTVEKAYNDILGHLYGTLYRDPVVKSEQNKCINIIKQLYLYYMEDSRRIPPEYAVIADSEGLERAVCDYISGMSDDYAINRFNELFIPKHWSKI